jgi:FKBP-type peptidyl-prolyl cis-trans isomerase
MSSFNGFENVISDGGVKKKIINKPAEDAKAPVSGEQVNIYYVGRLLDGQEFDSNIYPNKDKPLTFVLG